MPSTGEYEGTTELDYSSYRQAELLGFIGNGRGRGIWLHSTVAARLQTWGLEQKPEDIAVGLLHQKSWVRTQSGLRHQKWRQRLMRSCVFNFSLGLTRLPQCQALLIGSASQ